MPAITNIIKRITIKRDVDFNQVAIIGVGFLGASFALSLKKAGVCNSIYGYGRNAASLLFAKDSGIVDDYSLDLWKVCTDSDLIVLSTPVGAFQKIIGEINKIAKKGGVITDLGSVKGKLVYDIEKQLPQGVHYIGSHPIAGGEKSGVENARDDLFDNALCIVTPTKNSHTASLDKICRLWESIGSRVELMDPYLHDRVYAIVSHLPHLAAYALVNSVGEIDEDFIKYAGKGFKDMTRIAMSPPELWSDISLLNKENILQMINVFKSNLSKIEKFLKEDDLEGLKREFYRSRELRGRLK